ncbi:hypothetical protein BD769DRAFT_1463736, partial [Suillus cothurnatus]
MDTWVTAMAEVGLTSMLAGNHQTSPGSLLPLTFDMSSTLEPGSRIKARLASLRHQTNAHLTLARGFIIDYNTDNRHLLTNNNPARGHHGHGPLTRRMQCHHDIHHATNATTLSSKATHYTGHSTLTTFRRRLFYDIHDRQRQSLWPTAFETCSTRATGRRRS